MDIITIPEGLDNAFHPITGEPLVVDGNPVSEKVLATWTEEDPANPEIDHPMVASWWEDIGKQVAAICHVEGEEVAWDHLGIFLERFDCPSGPKLVEILNGEIKRLSGEACPRLEKAAEELKDHPEAKFPMGVKSIDVFGIIIGTDPERKILMVLW